MTGPGRVPERVLDALQALDLEGAQRVLEIGPGGGVAAGHVLRTFPRIRYVAVDRSPVACERTRKRNAEHVAAGRLAVYEGGAAALPTILADEDPFDTVFAIDVNVFWTRPAAAEMAAIAAVLRPGGRAWLFFSPPASTHPERIERRVGQALAESPLQLDQSGRARSVLRFRASGR